ncbi:hypothetical protein [Bradyrhizobium sp. CB3481]|uniref:hypothetical protein n=1 Tax=Bradyrhizobium sp. CB3481 TaxID=3039158 RepID=UPI0024B0EF4C|nr:hypothetical protein [Bradyrhizobium sp. CB3481]WFU14662.1 hypothetical protein QA643_26735 [Bradyrhizobium sp. CB3481]
MHFHGSHLLASVVTSYHVKILVGFDTVAAEECCATNGEGRKHDCILVNMGTA